MEDKIIMKIFSLIVARAGSKGFKNKNVRKIGNKAVFEYTIEYALKLEKIVQPLGYYPFLICINIIFLILGTFMDQNPIIIIMAPVFAPIAIHLGIDPIHFGVIVVVNVVIGLLTPPLGPILFIVSPIAKVKFEQVAKEIIPFLAVEIAVLILVSYIPSISLYIPKLLGYVQ